MQTTLSLSPSLATQVQRAWQELVGAAARLHRAGRRARQADATARLLGRLDDRALRDLGLGRSELLSAAAELHGLAERQRRSTLFGTPPAR